MQAFDRIVANIKGDIDYALKPCTVIAGRNKRGKTSVLDTIRLALTGKHPVGPHASNLAELAPSDALRLHAKLYGPSGNVAWEMESEDGRWKKPRPPLFSGALRDLTADQRRACLVLDHGDLLSFGADRMRRTITERFGELEEVPTPEGLNADQLAAWNSARLNTQTKADPSEQLVAMQKWFGEQVRVQAKAAEQHASVAERLKAEVESMGGGVALDQIKQRIKTAGMWEEAQGRIERRDALLAELEDINEQVAAARIEEAANVDTRAELTAELQIARAQLATHQRLLQVATQSTNNCCILCGTEDVDMSDVVRDIEHQIQDAQSQVNDLDRKLKGIPASKLPRLTERQRTIKATLDGINVELPKPWTGPSTIELKKQRDAIIEAENTRKRYEAEQAAAEKCAREQQTYRLMQQQATRMLQSFLQNMKSSAEEAVNRYMPEGFTASLQISETEVQWRMVGADQRHHKRGAMSGSEQGALALAVAQAWGENNPLRIVLLDDTDMGVFDPDTLKLVFQRFKASVDQGLLTQVIIGWNRPHEVPADWHVIELA